MTTFALKKFMLEQGPSKSTNLMEWDKLWAYNKDYIDPISPRYTAIVKETSAKIIINNFGIITNNFGIIINNFNFSHINIY